VAKFIFIWRWDGFCFLLYGIMKWDFVLRLNWGNTLRNDSRRDASPHWAARVKPGGVARRAVVKLAVIAV
jgi:hypothetical protein